MITVVYCAFISFKTRGIFLDFWTFGLFFLMLLVSAKRRYSLSSLLIITFARPVLITNKIPNNFYIRFMVIFTAYNSLPNTLSRVSPIVGRFLLTNIAAKNCPYLQRQFYKHNIKCHRSFL